MKPNVSQGRNKSDGGRFSPTIQADVSMKNLGIFQHSGRGMEDHLEQIH